MKKSLTEEHTNILKHSLGIREGDQTPTSKKFYRSYYQTDEGSKDFDACELLVEKGYMVRQKSTICAGYFYHVTKEGIEFVVQEMWRKL